MKSLDEENLREVSNKVSAYYCSVHDAIQMPDNSFQSFRTPDIKIAYNDVICDSMVTKEMKVLDLGFGLGSFDNFLAQNVGCDIIAGSNCRKEIEMAKKLYDNQPRKSVLDFVYADFHFLKDHFKEDVFDMVMFIESFEHAKDKRKVLEDVYKILKNGGRLFLKSWFLFTENRKGREKEFEEALRNEEKNLLIYSHLSLSDFLTLCLEVGFEPVLIKPPGFDSNSDIFLKENLDAYNKYVDGVCYIPPSFSVTKCYNVMLRK